jgi:hypothetical protein
LDLQTERRYRDETPDLNLPNNLCQVNSRKKPAEEYKETYFYVLPASKHGEEICILQFKSGQEAAAKAATLKVWPKEAGHLITDNNCYVKDSSAP